MAGIGSPYAVDTHPQRDQILKRFMDGHSIRAVGEGLVPPISSMALQRYKTNVIRPILARAQKSERILLGEPEVKRPLVPPMEGPSAVQSATQAMKDAPVLSLFRDRLEKLYGRLDRTMGKAESAVRLATDKDGNQVVVGADLAIIAPLANQIHKGLEMLGRATGELEPQGGGSVSIQILCPIAGATPEQMPRISYSDANAIEAGPPAVDETPSFGDINLIQN